jgi:hypothetical protein
LVVLHLVEIPRAILISVFFSRGVTLRGLFQVLDALWSWCPGDFPVVVFG